MQTKRIGPAEKFLDLIQPIIDAGEYADPSAMREAYGLCYLYLWSRARAIACLNRRGLPWGEPAFEMVICLNYSPLREFVKLLGRDPDPYIRCAAKALLVEKITEEIEPGSLEHLFLSQTFVFSVLEPEGDPAAVCKSRTDRFSQSHLMNRVYQNIFVAQPLEGRVN